MENQSPKKNMENKPPAGIIKDRPSPPPKSAKEEKNKKQGEIPAVRTFRGDIEKYTREGKTSYLDIVAQAAKRKKNHKKLHREYAGGPWFKIGIGLLVALALFTLALGGYLLLAPKEPRETPIALRPPGAIIEPEIENIISFKEGGTSALLNQIQEAVKKEQFSGAFTYLPIKKISADEEEKFLTALELLSEIGAETPSEIKNNLTPFSNFGVIDTFGQNEILFIIKVLNFERTFAGLLKWEEDMPENLAPLLPKRKSIEVALGSFKDETVANHDARVLRDIENKSILSYAIFNKQFLIITSSIEALELTLKKLITSPPTL